MALLQDNCPITRNENSHIFVINFNPFVLGEILSLFWEESSSIFDKIPQFRHQYCNDLRNFQRTYLLFKSLLELRIIKPLARKGTSQMPSQNVVQMDGVGITGTPIHNNFFNFRPGK